MQKKKKNFKGFGIVVIPSGWVYAGEITISKKWCKIKNAVNVRRWGTMAGLGELAKKGPLENTKLDPYGLVRIPLHQVITIIDSEAELWKKD